MCDARAIEITSSLGSLEGALCVGVKRASETLKNVAGVWVKDQEVCVVDSEVSDYRVKLKVTFVLEG